MKKLLLVEDDPSFGYVLKEYLELKGYHTIWLKDGASAIKILKKTIFDLCILDIMLPDVDGFKVAESIKISTPEMPFLFLTAKSLKVDKLKGFALGCDDYQTKPIDEELLVAKIQAILTRVGKQNVIYPNYFTIGAYAFDRNNQSLVFQNENHILTEKECLLLSILCLYQNQLVDRKKILKEVWGSHDMFTRKSMDVFVSRLRKYLIHDPSVKIINVHNKGFILQTP